MPDGTVDVYLNYLDSSIATQLRNATLYALSDVYSPVTDVFGYETTNVSVADVRVYDVSMVDIDYVAWTRCADGAATGGADPRAWCVPQILAYNNGKYPGRYDHYTERRRHACHEVGHTYGLRHAETYADDPNEEWSCMNDLKHKVQTDNPNQGITSHDAQQLTNLYPLSGWGSGWGSSPLSEGEATEGEAP